MINTIQELEALVNEAEKFIRKHFQKEETEAINKIKKTVETNAKDYADRLIVEGDSKALVIVAKAMGIVLKGKGVTSSQVRNIFGYVKKIEVAESTCTGPTLGDKSYGKLILLSPKLAYAIGRANRPSDEGLKLMKHVFDECIEKIEKNSDRFKRFMSFFEAILSYHKYYGGKK